MAFSLGIRHNAPFLHDLALCSQRWHNLGLKVQKTLSNSFLARGDFCRRLITFANSLDPDQDCQNVGPGLDTNRLTLRSEKSFEKVNLIKSKHGTLPSMQKVDRATSPENLSSGSATRYNLKEFACYLSNGNLNVW